MFNKLNYSEKGQLFNGLAVLEKNYGKEKTQNALEIMIAALEHEIEFAPVVPKQQETNNFEIGGNHCEQTLFDFDDEPKTKRARPISKKEATEKAAELGFSSLNDCLIDLYYRQKMKQSDIGAQLGCAQRTVSAWIHDIPQITLKKALE